mmetsp:Transcript_54659/g.114249  ORF Transcript_54659/g.114249 Transcript_54659/m.114249 type:complete len:369 (-) Transcript_54659:1637-2743(-)
MRERRGGRAARGRGGAAAEQEAAGGLQRLLRRRLADAPRLRQRAGRPRRRAPAALREGPARHGVHAVPAGAGAGGVPRVPGAADPAARLPPLRLPRRPVGGVPREGHQAHQLGAPHRPQVRPLRSGPQGLPVRCGAQPGQGLDIGHQPNGGLRQARPRPQEAPGVHRAAQGAVEDRRPHQARHIHIDGGAAHRELQQVRGDRRPHEEVLRGAAVQVLGERVAALGLCALLRGRAQRRGPRPQVPPRRRDPRDRGRCGGRERGRQKPGQVQPQLHRLLSHCAAPVSRVLVVCCDGVAIQVPGAAEGAHTGADGIPPCLQRERLCPPRRVSALLSVGDAAQVPRSHAELLPEQHQGLHDLAQHASLTQPD